MNKKSNAIHLLPAIMLVIGVSATFFASQIAENFMELFGLLLVVALAALLMGTLLGFLFGIPKTNYNNRNQNEQKNQNKPVTNLEDISNWLSIMLVGLILTQATKFPYYLESIANSILANNDCVYNCQFAHAIIIGEIVFSAISGFILGYAYTRLYFSGMANLMKENEQQNAEINIWKEGYNKVSEENTKSFARRAKLEETSKSKLSSFLTEDEINVLNMIVEENNNFVVRKPLSFKEHAAINVLVEKGIVHEIEGGSYRTGATLSITDRSLIEALK